MPRWLRKRRTAIGIQEQESEEEVKRRKLDVQMKVERMLAREKALSEEPTTLADSRNDTSTASGAVGRNTEEHQESSDSDSEDAFIPDDDECFGFEASDFEADDDNRDDNDIGSFWSFEEEGDDVQEPSYFEFDDESTSAAATSSSTVGSSPATTTSLYGDSEEHPTVEEDVDLSDLEKASLDLILLCDDSGARRGFYNDLLAFLRRLRKKRVDITQAKGRETFVKVLEEKVKSPKPRSKKVGGRDVIYFPFLESLRDLLRSATFDDVHNLCVNTEEQDRFKRFQPSTDQDIGEIMSKRWSRETQDQMEDFDPDLDFFLAVMLYGDKTGTDVNQRYPLEPWMYTVLVLRLCARQQSHNWRHIGFVPSQDVVSSDSSQQGPLSAEQKLQQHHDYMSVMLEDLKIACQKMPIMWVNLGGQWQRRRLRIKLCVVTGDQMSQDIVCGRMSINRGDACRIHRGCMASGVHSIAVGSDGVIVVGCKKPPIDVIRRLNELALLDVSCGADSGPMSIVNSLLANKAETEIDKARDHLRRVQKLAKAILNKVFSMHALRNAFDGIDFGANEHGILVAATEDHLHSCEAGFMLNLAEVSYQGLVLSERTELEGIIRPKVLGCKSSVLSDYPRGTVKTDFSKLTLLSHKEKVGSVYYLLLGLHDKRGREIIETGHQRQKKKYLTFPTKTAVKSLEGTKRSGKKRRLMPPVADSDDGNKAVADCGTTDAMAAGQKALEPQLPASAFPYRKDLLYGTDHALKHPFDRTDESIEFVCRHLRLHGFGFLLDGTEFDDYQLDVLMVQCWQTLRQFKTKPGLYPSDDTIAFLSSDLDLRELFVSQEEGSGAQDEHGANGSSLVELTCKASLRRSLPLRVIDINAEQEAGAVRYQNELKIRGCLPKHRKAKPVIKGTGDTCAVLSDMDTFLSFVELVLCYHAWCHYGGDLSRELQEDNDLIRFATGMVVQYFDTILYRGDNTVDSDTCKNHSQLHGADVDDNIGNQMQYCTETGERGLKVWAKGVSRTALKHGRDVFTHSTAKRVGERLLLNAAADRTLRKQVQEETASPTTGNHRKMPHFRFGTAGEETPSSNMQLSCLRRDGREAIPDETTGIIQPEILKAISNIERERGSVQRLFEIWCEAKLPNGDNVRCWPQYRGKEGCRYDWAMVRFESQGDAAATQYPAKVLALYEDLDGNFKALVHSAHFKLPSNPEGPYGDSRLVTHYRLHFHAGGSGDPLLYSVRFEDLLHCIVAYEAILYPEQPLVPRVPTASRRREHTVMTILPRKQWAKLFLEWAKEIRGRQTTVNGRGRHRLDW